MPLEALLIRYATLIDQDPNRVRVPVHIRPLSNAFQQMLSAQKFAGPVLVKIFDFFTREFLPELENYYLYLNETLARQGIRPDVEKEIAAKGTLLNSGKPPRPAAREGAGAQKQPASAEEQAAAIAGGPGHPGRDGPVNRRFKGRLTSR